MKKNQPSANLLFLGFHNTFSFGLIAQIVRFNFVHSNSQISFFGGGGLKGKFVSDTLLFSNGICK